MSETVKVIVRCRPINTREKDLKCKCVVSMDGARGQCSITNPSDDKAPPKNFTFDGAYFVDSTTESIYADIAYPLVEVSLISMASQRVVTVFVGVVSLHYQHLHNSLSANY